MKPLTMFAALMVGLAAAPVSAQRPPAEPIALAPPPAGKGQLVFFRQGGIGPIISCAVSKDGQRISSLPPGRYFVHVAEPGTHSFTVSGETKDTLTVQVEADETQYVRCNIAMGIMSGRPNLAPSDEAAWLKASPKLKPVEAKEPAEAAAE